MINYHRRSKTTLKAYAVASGAIDILSVAG
jgi:hypothetical protein